MIVRVFFFFVLLASVALGRPGDAFKKGQVLPSFRATDQLGQQRDSAQLLGPQGAILVIFRSADW